MLIFGTTEGQRGEKAKGKTDNVVISEFWVKNFEIRVVDVFEDWRLEQGQSHERARGVASRRVNSLIEGVFDWDSEKQAKRRVSVHVSVNTRDKETRHVPGGHGRRREG